MQELNSLSVFNGMGCLWYAFDRNGIKVNKRYSAEIDRYANKANDVAYPDTIQLGDVRLVDVSLLEKIDFFAGGSPCTDLSFAGTQSGLICNSLPEYMDLRNEWLETGNEELYFHNGKFQESILFWEWLRILKDIQKINPQVKFLLENVRMTKKNERIINTALGLHPVIINSNKVSAQNRLRYYWTNIKTRNEGLFGDVYTDIPQPKDKGIFLKNILQPESEIDEKYYMSSVTIENMYENSRFSPHISTIKKAYSITTHPQRSNSNFIKIDKNGNKKADQSKAGCLTAGGNSGGNHSDMELDVLLSSGISDTQLYRMFGNGWTVDMIAWIISFMKE